MLSLSTSWCRQPPSDEQQRLRCGFRPESVMGVRAAKLTLANRSIPSAFRVCLLPRFCTRSFVYITNCLYHK